jgi:hypothetical protein
MKATPSLKTTSVPQKLSRADWDFSSVSDDELESCFLLEYFRELPDPGRRSQKPFQSLTLAEKKARISSLRDTGMNAYDRFMRIQLDTKIVYATLRLQNRLLLLGDPDESQIIADFIINWEHPDTVILQQLAIWMRQHRPRVRSSHKRGIKKNSLRVHLERLGIMRLLHHHSPKEIRNKMPDAWRLLSRREFFKDRKRARQVFWELFPPFHNGELLPNSWPTKAGKSK